MTSVRPATSDIFSKKDSVNPATPPAPHALAEAKIAVSPVPNQRATSTTTPASPVIRPAKSVREPQKMIA